MYVDYTALGKRIAKRRKELGYKQTEVTEMAKLSDKYLSNIERATSIPSIDVLMKLCDVLQTTPDCFLLGTSNTPLDHNSLLLCAKMQSMTPKQAKLALSLFDWILSENLST